MKKILLSSISLLALSSYGLNAATVDERLAELEKELKIYKEIKDKQIANIEEQIKLLKAENKKSKKKVDEVSEILEDVETKTLSDKIDLGLTFKTRYDDAKFKNSSYEDNSMVSSRVNINMKAKISDDIKFTGRLTAAKYCGPGFPSDDATLLNTGRSFSGGSEVYLERAYVDWKAYDGDIPVIFTIGRQPNTDGYGFELGENSVKKGTYDPLLFDTTADGLILTLPLDKVIDNEGLALRLATGYAFRETTLATYNEPEDAIFFGAFLEGSIPYTNRGKFYLSYAKISDMIIPEKDLGTVTIDKQNVGDITLAGASIEFPNVIEGLNLFTHYGISESKSNGATVTIPPAQTLQLLNDGTGDAFWLGGRYDTKYGKFGLEYNYGSKNWINFTRENNTTAFNKLSTRGSVWDFYYIKELAKATHLKLGVALYDYDYTSSGDYYSTPNNSKEKIQNMYGEFVVNF